MRKNADRPDSDFMKRVVAYLLSMGDGNGDMDQASVARRLNISQSTVHRLKEDCLTGSPKLLEIKLTNHLTPTQIAEIHAYLYPDESNQWLTKNIPALTDARVFTLLLEPKLAHLPEEKRAIARWEQRAIELSNVAAPVIRDWIRTSESIGITSRYTMFWTLEGLRRLHKQHPWPNDSKVKFIPLWGHAYKYCEPDPESQYVSHEQLSASSICSGLNKLFNSAGTPQKSIDGFPGILPLSWAKSNTKIDSFLKLLGELSCSYTDVVKDMEVMHGALVPVGTPLHESRFWSGEYLEQSGFTKEDRKTFVRNLYGDMGGIPIIKTGLDQKESKKTEKLVSKISKCWVGVKREHLLKCAKTARDKPELLGVTVIGCGRERSNVIYEAAKIGLCNRVVIDNECAEGIKEAYNSDPCRNEKTTNRN